MVKSNQVFLVTDESSLYLLNDLYRLPDVNSYIIKNENNFLLSLLRKIHLNKKIAKYLWLPKRDIWFDKEKIVNSIPSNGVLLINSAAMCMPSKEFWDDIMRKRTDVKFVLLLVDSMHTLGGHMVETRARLKSMSWDMILSYDKYDCDEFGFKYIGLNYYSKYNVVGKEIKNDLYYISSVKNGRARILKEIYRACKVNGVKQLFHIYSMWRFISYGKCIRKVMSYDNVIKNISESNCILEIIQSGQKAQTLRYLEAIIYGKKLLTNNHAIFDLPFYNQRQMKVFNDVKDIDWEWVKKRENFKDVIIYSSSANLLDYI